MQDKETKKHIWGQYMTPKEVAKDMCCMFESTPLNWVILDPACGDGVLLEEMAIYLIKKRIPTKNIHLIGIDIDPEMISNAKKRISAINVLSKKNIKLINGDTLEIFSNPLINIDIYNALANVNIIIGNPPYGKRLETKFFEACDKHFSKKAELVFLLPLAFVDSFTDIKFSILKGRPLGVTTGHVVVHHHCGAKYSKKRLRIPLDAVNGFSVLTGVKLYSIGAGNPPQTSEIVKEKPFTSTAPMEGWLPCLRTGDIQKYSYSRDRLWVKYGNHLAHPKDLERFKGPRIVVRRVPIWASKTLGAAYIEETALCAGDVLVVRHSSDAPDVLKGLCVFLNSEEVANYITSKRPSVGVRDSFPKISGKDLVGLFKSILPPTEFLIKLSETYQDRNEKID